MTRARAIEEALRECVSVMEEMDEVSALLRDEVPTLDRARAALSLPADAPPDEYRRGVDLVTCDMYRHGCLIGLIHVHQKDCVNPVSALAPPAPRSERREGEP
jgi:hypothetical protein